MKNSPSRSSEPAPSLRALCLALLLAIPLPVFGAQWMVDAEAGNDTNPGDATAPFRTIQAAVDKMRPGDTVLVRDGVYRETVTVRAMGTAENPLAIKADHGANPVLSGADLVTQWKVCQTADEASGNPDFASIFYTDLEWEPTAIFEDGLRQRISWMPNSGWWPAPNTTPLTLSDPEKLRDSNIVPDGSTLFFFKHKGFAWVRQTIKSFDATDGTIHVEKPLGRDQFVAGSDRYRLENHVRFIDQPGEWAWTKRDNDLYRLYYRPIASDITQARIEVPRRSRLLVLSQTAHCTVEGLEVTQAAYPGKVPDSAIGNDVSKQIPGAGESITIRFCKIHHNGRYGIQGRGYKNLVVENNLIRWNEYGVAITGNSTARVENNDIGHNLVDGLIVSWGSRDVVVRNNYIHHQTQFGHPDNVQFYRGVDNILVEGNFILAAGQSVMMEEVENVTFRNNVVAGSAANMMILGHGNSNNGKWERNTLALWCSSLFSFTGQNYSLNNNMFINTGGRLTYGIPAKGTFASTSNLWFQREGIPFRRLAGKAKETGEGSVWFDSLEALQQGTGQEAGSVFKNPDFKNVPAYLTTLNVHRIGESTREKLFYDPKGIPPIGLGDTVEIHFDGIPRRVVAAEEGAIVIDPPLQEFPDRELFIANWKQTQEFTLDFTSPHNADFGSTIQTVNYTKGDFNGDGQRDIPEE